MRVPQAMTVSVTRLTDAVAPASLNAALDGLKRAGAIRAYQVIGGVVRIMGDLTALELAALRLDEEQAPKLGDDAERGFRVSSDVNGRRGSPTAKAADLDSTRAYYDSAAGLLQDRSLSPRARRIWQLHSEGFSEERIAAQLGMARRRVVRQLTVLRCKAGITKGVHGWANKGG
jgi:DNA-binding CsgD family transcriptional regulator